VSKQKKFLVGDLSRLSAADAGLGVAGGLIVPVLVNMGIERWQSPDKPPWLSEWAQQIAGVSGVVLAIPLAAWRGLAPAMLSGLLGITYGTLFLAGKYMAGTSAGASAPTTAITPPTTAPSMGRLQAQLFRQRQMAMGRLQAQNAAGRRLDVPTERTFGNAFSGMNTAAWGGSPNYGREKNGIVAF